MQGHSVDKYVTGTMTQTSNACGWTNILAERWRHAAGELPSLTPRETEIAILLSGSGVVDRRGGGMRQHTVARKGTIWLCPAGVEEEFISVTGPLHDCLHIFLPGQPFSDAMLREFDMDPDHIELRYESIDQDPFIEFIAGRVLQELTSESSAGRLLMETLSLSLSAHLIRQYSGLSLRPGPAPSAKPLSAHRLSRVEEFVASHLDRNFTVSDLASVACMSVAHFTRAFRGATGKTPHGYVSERRMALAKQRLRDENWSILEIASAAGFSSHANFTRAFKADVGLTPAAFRAGAMNGDR